jgi:hypothetical protein
MYITMGAIVEFIYFEPTSAERFVSAIVCVVFNVYFVIYELYIYYDMIRYPLAQIGNKTYEYYILRYGSFLKNIRYEEYDVKSLLLRSTKNGVRNNGFALITTIFFLTIRSLS